MHDIQANGLAGPNLQGALEGAERALVQLSALDADSRNLTDLGRTMAQLPITPRHARMLMQVTFHFSSS